MNALSAIVYEHKRGLPLYRLLQRSPFKNLAKYHVVRSILSHRTDEALTRGVFLSCEVAGPSAEVSPLVVLASGVPTEYERYKNYIATPRSHCAPSFDSNDQI